ncbi:Mg chelatase-related domain-containing protein [Rhizobium sp. TAL182]|nr:Mg chelatase-related domain-containing protein [Rhizobium sp. TAL182]
MPAKRVTVNLAPADLPKEGSHFDLPIALALIAALGAIPADVLSEYLVAGEVNLDGTIAAIAGGLPAAIGANALGKGLICPAESSAEAAWPAPRSMFSHRAAWLRLPIISAAPRCCRGRSRHPRQCRQPGGSCRDQEPGKRQACARSGGGRWP